ncbi:uncharacterized protein LOC123887229 [Trifolium pratense]|uniref:uncharacterized protein LOC123887229 n=1 Tax=Trifolium pratense TaxID=57577 RepID=UPI001E6924AC|nr:uncharacterized protein LOC123887229 [Trifolium pratense]
MFHVIGNEPRDEVEVYTWMDATLKEINHVKLKVHHIATRRNAKFSLATVSRNKKFNYEVRKCASLRRQPWRRHRTFSSQNCSATIRPLHLLGIFHSRKMKRGGSNIGVVNVTNSNDSDELDPEYALFLNSVTILDGNDDYMHVKNTTNTSQEENMSNSSDSDLIIDDNEDYDDSQFRTRLMERLNKPYDHEEYKNLISKLCDTNQKERHFKQRPRVVESYHSKGFTTPYCETYPDITKAIAKVSTEKPRVLFLLRGFFFWLENVSHMGSFQPWHDELCLELLRKM